MASPQLFVIGVFVGAVLSWAATKVYYRMRFKREVRDKYVQLSLAQLETQTLQRRLDLMSQITGMPVPSVSEVVLADAAVAPSPSTKSSPQPVIAAIYQ